MLRLKTLGGLSIQADTGPVAGAATQRRRLAVLALLARSGERGVSRDKLLGFLWPDSDPERGRSVLAQALYTLRRDLGAEDLFLGTIDLRLNPELISTDVARFAAEFSAGRYEDAVALYEGPFLDGFYVSDAPEFERWVEVERTNLAHDYALALERLAGAATARQDPAGAVTWWRKLAAADPLNARHALGLMRALADSGDRAGAIQHARVHETLLRQEIDAAPDQRVLALAEHLREDPHPPVQPGPAAAPARPPVPSPPPGVASGSATAPAPAIPASVPAPRPRPMRYIQWAGWAVAIVLLALAARSAWRPAPSGRRMVAVLPFENLGPAQDEYFSDGLTEEVTARLAGIHGLGVISRTSSMQYKHTSKSLRQIGQELGVDYVLEGSVRWTKSADGAGRVRVTPQLIQVSDDSHLWADRYDAELADIFQVQGHIAEQVAHALDVTLGAPERAALTTRPTGNLQAYDVYVRANGDFEQAWGNEVALRKALDGFQQAVRLDSGFAVAWAQLSRAHSMMFRLEYDDSEGRLKQAREALDIAFRLDPDLTEGHIALGYYRYWGLRDYAGARTELLRALEKRPNDPDAITGLGYIERRQGQWADAVRHLDQAAAIDPRAGSINWDCGLAHFFTRDYEKAEDYLDRAILLAPGWALPYTSKARLYLSWHGDVARARTVLNEATENTSLESLFPGLNDVPFLLLGDSTRRVGLDTLSLHDIGGDSITGYMWRAQWHRYRGEAARERAAWQVVRDLALRWQQRLAPLEQAHPSIAEQPHVALALAYAGLRMKPEALKEIERATALLPYAQDAAWGADRGVMFAQAYARLGEPALAIQLLHQLLAVPSPISPASLRVDPAWDPLRSDPRFQALLTVK